MVYLLYLPSPPVLSQITYRKIQEIYLCFPENSEIWLQIYGELNTTRFVTIFLDFAFPSEGGWFSP